VLKKKHPHYNTKNQNTPQKKKKQKKKTVLKKKKNLKLGNVRLVHTISTEQEPKTLLIPLKTMKPMFRKSFRSMWQYL
jgi:hypothetical protein